MKLKIEVTPYSSVVGRGLVLTDDWGRVVGQIALLNSTEITDYKAYSEAVANTLAEITVDVPAASVRPRP